MKKSLENIARNGLKLVVNTHIHINTVYNTSLAEVEVG